MGYLSLVREFCEYMIVHRNQFCMKQHLLGKKMLLEQSVQFGEEKLIKKSVLNNITSVKVRDQNS